MSNYGTKELIGPRYSKNLLNEVLMGLSRIQKIIHPKYLYDTRGSEIFEEICNLPEYYPTRSENEILRKHASELASLIGDNPLIVEPGSGRGEKIRHILKEIKTPTTYIPIEISKSILFKMTYELHENFPELHVIPLCADITQGINLPPGLDVKGQKKVVFFPGSTIGNFDLRDALSFLKNIANFIGRDGALIIGVDLKKDRSIFEMAYNDSRGVTAAFNLNLLERLNREINASFVLQNFEHIAFYNESKGRVEMHLRSRISQLVKASNTIFRFREGETIHTESSYKYSTKEFCEICAKVNLKLVKSWQDSNNLFCTYYFVKG